MALTHVVSGLMNGLGLQAKALRISLISSFLCVLLTYALPALPGLRIYGAILSLACAQAITLALSLRALYAEVSKGYISR